MAGTYVHIYPEESLATGYIHAGPCMSKKWSCIMLRHTF